MADCEARDTTILMGVVRAVAPRARSLTPSLMPCTARVAASSRRVIGLEGSIRPWLIQSWIRSRLMGDISRAKLWHERLEREFLGDRHMEHAQILESLFSSDDLVWRLTTLELRRKRGIQESV